MVKYFCDVCQKEKDVSELHREILQYGSYRFETLDVCNSCRHTLGLTELAGWRACLRLAKQEVDNSGKGIEEISG